MGLRGIAHDLDALAALEGGDRPIGDLAELARQSRLGDGRTGGAEEHGGGGACDGGAGDVLAHGVS